MYAIKRSDGLFLSEGAVYVNNRQTKPAPVWQSLEDVRNIYTEESLWHIGLRRDRIARTYKIHKLFVVELTNEDMQCITFGKLKG